MSEISIVEAAAPRDIRFLPAEEKDLIFQTFAQNKIFNPLVLAELRRLIDKPEVISDFGEGDDAQLHSAIELAAELDGINALIVPLIKLPKHDFSVVKRGIRRIGGAMGHHLVFTEPRLAYVDLPRPVLMAVASEVVIESVKLYARNSPEFRRHIEAGKGKPANVKSMRLLGAELKTEDIKPGPWLLELCAEIRNLLMFNHIWIELPRQHTPIDFKPTWLNEKINDNLTKIAAKIGKNAVDKSIAIVELQQINLLPAVFVKNSNVIAKYLLRMERRAANAANKVASDAAIALRKLYEHIISSKFGHETLIRAISKANASGTADILSVLPASEKKIVEAEKMALDKQLAVIRGNTCGHLKLLRDIDRANGTERTSLVEQLGEYIGEVKQNEEIICKKCHLNLMCPHTYTLLRGEREIANYTIIIKNNAYCKLCGELLSLEAGDDSPRMEMDQEIAELIWDEAIILTRLLDLPPAISFSKFIQNMRSDVYKFVAELYSSAAKSKTAAAKEVKARQRIYAAIYVLAWFVKYALNSANSGVSFRGVQLQKGKEAPTLLHHCIKSILSIYAGRLVGQGLTAEILKVLIVQAYKSLIVNQYDVSRADIDEDITNFILNDALYNALCQIEQMTIKTIPKDLPVNRINRLLGINPEKLKGKIAKPKVARKGMKAEISGGSIWEHAVSPHVGNKHLAALWAHLLDMAQGAADRAPVFINTSSTRGRYASVTVAISEEYAKAVKAMEKLSSEEEKARFVYRNLMRKAVQVPIRKSQRRAILNTPQALSARYDEKGAKHKWDILVINGKDYTPADYYKTLPAAYPSTIKCSGCGQTREETEDKESDSKVHEALEMKYTLENFFRFYAFRCPAGDVHDLPTCGKCGWNPQMAESRGADAKQYFQKYQTQYAEQKKQEAPHLRETIALSKLPSASDDWSFNFDIVLELATKLNINHKQLSSLGGYEREDLRSVLDGSYIAREPDSPYSTRIFKLIGYLHSFVIEYNRLRNLGRIPAPPKSLLIFVEQHITRAQYKDLEGLIPLPADFLQRVEGTRRSKKPKIAFEYILQTFCEQLLNLLSVKGPLNVIATAFVKDFIRKVFNAEELLSKPGYFNWAIFYGKTASENVVQEDSGEIIENVNADEDEGGMSTKAFDIEEADPEDGGDDDEPNMIRLEGVD